MTVAFVTQKAETAWPAAFELRRERVYDLSRTYRGETTVATFEFPFYFGILPAIGTIALHLDTALALPPLRDNVLSYTIESDTSPKIDRYKITVLLAGEPEREVRGTLDRTGFHEAPSSRHASSTSPYPGAFQVVLGIPALLLIVGGLLLLGAVIGVFITRGGGVAGLLGGGKLGTIVLLGVAAVAGFYFLGERRQKGG